MSSSLLLSAASGATLAAGSVGLPALVATYWSRALSSSSAASRAAGGGGAAAAGTSPGQPDAFTAALQQKTEEELRLLALKQGQPHTAAEPAEQQQQEADGAEEVCGCEKRGWWRGRQPGELGRLAACSRHLHRLQGDCSRRPCLLPGSVNQHQLTRNTTRKSPPQELPEHGKREFGGYSGPEPTRYKDWEIKGRCSDF